MPTLQIYVIKDECNSCKCSFISGVSTTGGVKPDEPKVDYSSWNDTRKVVIATLAFIAGFTTIFVILFSLTFTLTAWLGPGVKTWILLIAGLAIIVMGFHFISLFKIGFLSMEKRFQFTPASKPAGLLGAYLVGAAFAGGWSPCVGPFLGAALSKSLDSAEALGGLDLMVVYSLGLGIPFLLAGIFTSSLLCFTAGFRRHYQLIEIVSGVLLVVVGLLIITNNMSELTLALSRI